MKESPIHIKLKEFKKGDYLFISFDFIQDQMTIKKFIRLCIKNNLIAEMKSDLGFTIKKDKRKIK